jgi:hypothetical protein
MPFDPQPLDYTFTATIQGDIGPAATWAIITMPNSFEFFGTGRAVKVVATIDGEEVTSAFMSNGEGMHLLPVKAAIRKKIGKGAGDEVTVHLIRRLS